MADYMEPVFTLVYTNLANSLTKNIKQQLFPYYYVTLAKFPGDFTLLIIFSEHVDNTDMPFLLLNSPHQHEL